MIAAAKRRLVLGALLNIGSVVLILPFTPYSEFHGMAKYALVITLLALGVVHVAGMHVRREITKAVICCNFFALCLMTLNDPEQPSPPAYGELSYAYLGWITIYTVSCLYLVDGSFGKKVKPENNVHN